MSRVNNRDLCTGHLPKRRLELPIQFRREKRKRRTRLNAPPSVFCQLQFLQSGLSSARDRDWSRMNRQVLEISTQVFHLLRRLAPLYISWSTEKAGPTQYIVVDDDVYSEIIDRAIAKRKTIDEVFLEIARRLRRTAHRGSRRIKRWSR